MQVEQTESLKKSTHKCEVVPITIEPHPNADRLGIVRVFGYTCCVAKDQWEGIELGVYVPPDSLVDVTRPEFSFLANNAKYDNGRKARVKAKKLRGIVSFGLLVPAPEGANVGDDLADDLGVEHWNPPEDLKMSQAATPPSCQYVSYDLDSLQRYAEVFTPGEPVVCTEKIHGSSARYVFWDGKMHCGSRKTWVEEGENPYWKALTPQIRNFCEENQGAVLHGEVYGWVQSLRYGHSQGRVSFAGFDIYQDGEWVCAETALSDLDFYGIPYVPIINYHTVCGEGIIIDAIPFDLDQLLALSEGPSLVEGADHYREGIVVSPVSERFDERVGRVKLKIVSPTYLEKQK